MSAPNSNAAEPPAGIKLEDVLFTLFRHKGKIVLFFCLGLLAAGIQYFVTPTSYQSTAKLLVRYVLDPSGAEAIGSQENIRRPDARGDSIMAAEIEILTSWDMLEDVARTVGPDRILGLPSSPDAAVSKSIPGPVQPPPMVVTSNVLQATKQLSKGLTATAPNHGYVLVLSYQNSQPETAFLVLNEIVTRYLEKHHTVHSAAGTYEFLLRQTDQLRSRLNQTEAELLKLKSELKIDNVEQAKSENNSVIARLTQSIRDAETELAGYQARLEEVHRLSGAVPSQLISNQAPVDPAILRKYKTLNDRLAAWRAQETSWLNQGFTAAYPLLDAVIQHLTEAEDQKNQLESEHPGLLASAPSGGGDQRDAAPDAASERMQIAAIQARMAILRTQLQEAEGRGTAIESSEGQIAQLERRRELERTNYIYFAESLERATVDSSIDPKQIPNIIPVQKPSAPLRISREMPKKLAMTVAIAIGLGVGLAFLLDLVLDPSIKRPTEIESRLRIPLMLSIPRIGRNGASRKLLHRGNRHKAFRHRKLASGFAPDVAAEMPSASLSAIPLSSHAARPERAPWEISHFVRPFCDALRDRLILLFQLKDMHHKPKLVALTGCSEGAGVTTLSAGLAASLSETGAGKVLLVDMNFGLTRVHPFLKGELASSLSQMIQPGASRVTGVADNLYLAAGTDPDGKPAALIPKKFYDLMPQLKASDFDYIIFDMPPLTETSATMALAPFMDQVLLVIQAEKDSRDQVKRAHSVLSNSRANVVGVFNKSRAQGPAWLGRDS